MSVFLRLFVSLQMAIDRFVHERPFLQKPVFKLEEITGIKYNVTFLDLVMVILYLSLTLASLLLLIFYRAVKRSKEHALRRRAEKRAAKKRTAQMAVALKWSAVSALALERELNMVRWAVISVCIF